MNVQSISSYNVIDLFCGSGGLSYGFEKAGFNILIGIDNDEKALETFELNHRDSKTIKGDITQISLRDIQKVIGDKEIDVIIGGPPCQGMSISGPRKLDDPRNELYLSFIRLVHEIRPKAFVIENVPGLVGLFGGKIKDSILEKFRELDYDVKYQILNSADYFVPQSRRRVFFVGMKKRNNFDFPEAQEFHITCKMALSDLPPLASDLGEEKQQYISEPKNEYQKLMRNKSNVVFNHIAARHSDRVKEIIALVPDGGNYKNLPEELQKTRNFNVAWTRFNSKKPAPTIDTGHRHHFHYEQNRVPTVRECARLQSFPDHFVFIGNKTEQFRQVGNAVPPLMAEKVARNLLCSLEED